MPCEIDTTKPIDEDSYILIAGQGAEQIRRVMHRLYALKSLDFDARYDLAKTLNYVFETHANLFDLEDLK